MKRLKGIMINGEWLGEKVVINNFFRTLCNISPIIMLEFIKLINKLEYKNEVFTITGFEFPSTDTIHISFENKAYFGIADLVFMLEENNLKLKSSILDITPMDEKITHSPSAPFEMYTQEKTANINSKPIIANNENTKEIINNIPQEIHEADVENIPTEINENITEKEFTPEIDIPSEDEKPEKIPQKIVISIQKPEKEDIKEIETTISKTPEAEIEEPNIIEPEISEVAEVSEVTNTTDTEPSEVTEAHTEEEKEEEEVFKHEEVINSTETSTIEIENTSKENTSKEITSEIIIEDDIETSSDESMPEISESSYEVENIPEILATEIDENKDIVSEEKSEPLTSKTIEAIETKDVIEKNKEIILENKEILEELKTLVENNNIDVHFENEEETIDINENIEAEVSTAKKIDYIENEEEIYANLASFYEDFEATTTNLTENTEEESKNIKKSFFANLNSDKEQPAVISDEDADFRILGAGARINAAILDEESFFAGEKVYKWGDTLYLER